MICPIVEGRQWIELLPFSQSLSLYRLCAGCALTACPCVWRWWRVQAFATAMLDSAEELRDRTIDLLTSEAEAVTSPAYEFTMYEVSACA